MKMQFFGALALIMFSIVAKDTHAAPKPRSWVSVTVRPATKKVAAGAPLDLEITTTNTHSSDAYLHFSSGQRFEVQLFKPGSSDAAYTWSADKMFTMMVSQLRLAPGQNLKFDAHIGGKDNPLPKGKYELRANLTNSSRIEAPPITIEVVANPMQFSLATDKLAFKIGEPVSFAMKLRNTGDKAQAIQFFSGQRFDVSVQNAAGQTVWNWAANKRFSQSLSKLSLAPGEETAFEASWDGRALPDFAITPGTYSVHAQLTGRPALEAAPVSVEIR